MRWLFAFGAFDRKNSHHEIVHLHLYLAFSIGLHPSGRARVLFNGKDLSGWTGQPGLWSVEDRAITGRATAEHAAKQNTFLIWEGQAAGFELRFNPNSEVKMAFKLELTTDGTDFTDFVEFRSFTIRFGPP